MPTIEITRQNLSISRSCAEAARTADTKQARRILAKGFLLVHCPAGKRSAAIAASATPQQTPLRIAAAIVTVQNRK